MKIGNLARICKVKDRKRETRKKDRKKRQNERQKERNQKIRAIVSANIYVINRDSIFCMYLLIVMISHVKMEKNTCL